MSSGQGIPGGQRLSAGHAGLAFGVPASTPGTMYALAISGGIAIRP
jgi:hypothetical protein